MTAINIDDDEKDIVALLSDSTQYSRLPVYENSIDNIRRNIENKDANMRIYRPENIGKSHSLAANIYARIPIGKWWVMMYSISGNIGRLHFDYEYQKIDRNIWSLQLYTSQTFTFLKNYSIELAAWGMPKSAQTFGMSDNRIYIWAGIKGSFLKQKLTVKLGVNDILNNNYWRENNTYPDGSVYNGTWYWNSRGVSLNVSYRFGKENIQPRQRKTGDNDELDRMGGGNSDNSNQGKPRK
jgi:hypothetical protein